MTRRRCLAEYLPYARRFLLGAVIGAAVFFIVFGPHVLDVTYDSWIRNGYVEEDIIQHYATWQFFRSDEWQFSLTWMNNAAGPEGVAAAWGDPLPWAALFFKALSPVLPATFQYFGIIGLLHFVLQGGFAALLVSLFDKRWSLCGAGSLLFCLQPVFLERMFRHMALTAQWLVLAMLCLYFIGRRIGRMPWFWWCVVFGLIPGVHPYFLPMAFGLICASALETMIKKKRVVGPLALVVGSVAIAVICARGLGVIMPGAATGDGGFGKYSMNLMAPFDPTSADFFAESGSMDWSLLVPAGSRVFYQYDGFNYLGLGLLLGLAAMAVFAAVMAVKTGVGQSLKKAGSFLLDHIGLAAASVVFTLFALSNRIYWGETLLIDVALPEFLDNLFSSFRASGRMFWPVSYLVTLSVLLFIARRIKMKKVVAAALILLLAVQTADMSGVLLQKQQYFWSRPEAAETGYDGEKAASLISSAGNIRCLEGPIYDYRFAESLIRHNPAVQTNIVFFAKGNFVDTYSYYPIDEALLLSGQPVPGDTLYVTSDKALCLEILGKGHPDLAAWQLEDFYLIGTADQRPAPDFE